MMSWLLSTVAILGACALVILLERAIDYMFYEGDDFE